MYGFFLYSISSLDASKFQSANFIPVKLVKGIDTNSPVSDQEQGCTRCFPLKVKL